MNLILSIMNFMFFAFNFYKLCMSDLSNGKIAAVCICCFVNLLVGFRCLKSYFKD